MPWSATVLAVPGKTGEDGATLPVVRHLEDAGKVADLLWDRWVPTRTKAVLADDLGGDADDREDAARLIYVWLCSIHDVGKLTPDFMRTLSNRPEWSHLSSVLPPPLTVPTLTRRNLHHRVLGHDALVRWLVRRYDADRLAAHSVACVIGAHHGVPANNVELTDVPPTSPEWMAVQDEVLDEMADAAGVEVYLPRLVARDVVPMRSQVLLAGLVVVADWLASDQDRFPVDRVGPVEPAHVINIADLPPPWVALEPPPVVTAHIEQRFPSLAGATPRPIQKLVFEAAHAAQGPALIVVEGDLGGGKTEAALIGAEILSNRLGLGGVMFCLPTRATTDGIFPRLRRWVDALPGSGATSMVLAHGKATLNDDYRGLMNRERFASMEPEVGRDGHVVAVVASWLQGRRKGVLANFVAATIDQVLVLALRSKFLQLRHLACAGKVVIVDEVHAADEYMRAYLLRALEWLGAYGTPVILVSATLPPAVRQDLVRAWCEGAGMPVPTLDPADIYPRVTSVDASGSTTRTIPLDAGSGRQMSINLSPFDEAIEAAVSAVEAGACVGVIHNTVGRAQATYDHLVDRLGPDRVVLVHSRFVSVDRQQREGYIRACLGPPGVAHEGQLRPGGIAVVGTQVLEQSLDIDVDLMVSDVAPIDLLLQRAGRLHRHRRGAGEVHRPPQVREARLFVVGATVGTVGPPLVDREVSAIYGEWRIYQALQVLTPFFGGQSLHLPRDIAPLVRQGYDDSVEPPQGWEAEWCKARSAHLAREQDRRARADTYRLDPYPHTTDSDLRTWISGRTGEPDETKGQAAVRDGEESLEVVVVVRDGSAVRPFPGCGVPAEVDLSGQLAAPPDRHARRVAGCTLPLPTAMTRFRGGDGGVPIDRVIRDLERQAAQLEGWRSSRWLAGTLPLLLEPTPSGTWSASVDRWDLTYDAQRGLVTRRREQER